MKVIVCVDENGGMLFNGRRQSRDRVLVQHLLQRLAGRRLWVNGYSAKLFPTGAEAGVELLCAEDFLQQAGQEDFCFVENLSLAPWQDKISELWLCCWNRTYPADQWLDIEKEKFNLAKQEEFEGSSHEKITVEVYCR